MKWEQALKKKDFASELINQAYSNLTFAYSSKQKPSPPGVGLEPLDKDNNKLVFLLEDNQQRKIITDKVVPALSDIPTEIIVTGRAYSLPASQGNNNNTQQRQRLRPARPGCFISRFEGNGEGGTLGCFVRLNPTDKENAESGTLADKDKIFLLSCTHVLADISNIQNIGAQGDIISQPHRSNDNGQYNENQIAILSSFEENLFSSQNSDLVDAAIAKVTCQITCSNNNIQNLNNHLILNGYHTTESLAQRIIESSSNSRLSKFGAQTGNTSADINSIISLASRVQIGYNNSNNVTYNTLITIQSELINPFSQPGDSGSLIYETNDNNTKAVGLVVAGSENNDNNTHYTYAIPIDLVLERLKIKLITG